MEFPEHMAHSMLQTIYSIPSIHSIHSRVSPHHVHCAMCSASQKCHALLNFRGGLGCVFCWLAERFVQSRYCEQCRTDKYGCVRMCTDVYGGGAHGAVSAMRSGNSKAHGSLAFCAMSVPVRTSPYQSVLHCPLPVHCAMCSASQKHMASLKYSLQSRAIFICIFRKTIYLLRNPKFKDKI